VPKWVQLDPRSRSCETVPRLQTGPGLIALTCNEISRLFNRLIIDPARRLLDPLTWINWRAHHQHRARTSHYRHRPET